MWELLNQIKHTEILATDFNLNDSFKKFKMLSKKSIPLETTTKIIINTYLILQNNFLHLERVLKTLRESK